MYLSQKSIQSKSWELNEIIVRFRRFVLERIMIEGQFPPYTLSCSKAVVLAIAYEIIQKQNS